MNQVLVHQHCNEHPEEFADRIKQAIEAEENNSLATWYLSFADENGWKGAIVVDAKGAASAIDLVNKAEINPGGSVMEIQLNPENAIKAASSMNRLLNMADCQSIWGKMSRTKIEQTTPDWRKVN